MKIRASLMRATACFTSFLLVFQASAVPLKALGDSLVLHAALAFQEDPPEFSEEPRTPETVPNPARDPDLRNGIWNSDLRYLLGELEDSQKDLYDNPTTNLPAVAPENVIGNPGDSEEDISAKRNHGPYLASSYEEPVRAFTPRLGDTGGGPPMPWEGYFPGGGSNSVDAVVNTNTGNRYMNVPILSAVVRGGMQLDFSLSHNSKNVQYSGFGANWSTFADARIRTNFDDGYISTSNTLVLTMGNGRTIPYTYDYAHTKFVPPAGYYDTIQSTGTTTHFPEWTLTTKYGVKYVFKKGLTERDGLLCSITDKTGNNQIVIDRNQYSISQGLGVAEMTAIRILEGATSTRRITFGYSGSKIVHVRDWTQTNNRIWKFTYTGDDLTAIEYPHPTIATIPSPTSPTQSGFEKKRYFAYDSYHNITSETDLRGKIWTCAYDSSERLTNFKEPGISTIEGGATYTGYTFTYATDSCTMSDPYARTNKHVYNSGQLFQDFDARQSPITYGWDSVRRVQSVTDRRGKIWQTSYDAMGNVLSTTDPAGNNGQSEHSYATYGSDNLTTTTYGDLSPSTLNYEWTSGKLSRIWRQNGQSQETIIQSGVNSVGLSTQVTAYDGVQSRPYGFAFDPFGSVVSVADASATPQTSYFTRDTFGRILTLKDPTNAVTKIDYDRWGRSCKVKKAR
jgi:YD repeat-containing protein